MKQHMNMVVSHRAIQQVRKKLMLKGSKIKLPKPFKDDNRKFSVFSFFSLSPLFLRGFGQMLRGNTVTINT